MGKTSDSAKKSFGREIGKNAADYVSNKILGDKYAKPSRVAISVQKEQIKAEAQERQATVLEAQLEYQKEKDFDTKLQSINQLVFSSEKNEITNILSLVISLATSTIAKDDNNEQPIIEACVTKAEEGIYRLKCLNENIDADFYNQKLEKIKGTILQNKKKATQTTIGLIIFVIAMISIIFLIAFFKKH